jgi:hypothetical protein
MRLFKQLLVVFAVLAVAGCRVDDLSYDVIKIDWLVLMELQESYGCRKNPCRFPPVHPGGRRCLSTRYGRAGQPCVRR